MKEEIKEILDNTLEYLEGIDETRNTKILTTNETNILLDYITNLKDYKQRNEKVIQYIESLFNTIDYKDEEFITFDTLQNIQDLAKYGQLKGDKDE